MIQSKEFIESTNCKVIKAYNHHSYDTYHSPFGKRDIENKINNFFKENPNIEIISTSYIDAVVYEETMPVHVSKMLLIYKQK